MSNEIVFYHNPQSRGRTVHWMLEEVGVPYETVLLDYGSTMKGADYLAVNPMGKVPAIKHGAYRRTIQGKTRAVAPSGGSCKDRRRIL